ncbi:MAG: TrbC/VirB2 family protein [Pseudomonadota bacterium]
MVITAALEWVLTLLTGPLVTIILSISVAAIGFLMLLGELPVRRAALTILGGFILIGAGQIAQSLVLAVPVSPQPVTPTAATSFDERNLGDPPAPPPRRRGNPFDPYSSNETVN